MITVIIQIGNSDDKLTQSRWSRYVHRMQRAIDIEAHGIEFSGGAPNWKPWQNYCWVITINPLSRLPRLEDVIERIRKRYNQDSVAITIGTTKFI